MTNRASHRHLLAALLSVLVVPGAVAQEEDPPETIQITGIVRDFKAQDQPGGHPDFENQPQNGMARYAGVIDIVIGDDGKPAFAGNGAKITNQWRDDQNRQISYCMYDNFPQAGDTPGSFGQAGNGGITSAKTFAHWFKDVPVYNMSRPLTLTLTRIANGNYVFDDQTDPYYIDLGGFFPIDDELFGNSASNGNGNGNGNGGGGGNQDHNFHFTFELHTEFVYDASVDQSFKFEGTDSVWLFIDGHLVNDIIGVHASHDQYVDVHRLGLVDGESYQLDFFFAQRHEPQSHFRIETSLLLEGLPITTVSAVYD